MVAHERLFEAELACGRAAVALPDSRRRSAASAPGAFRSELVLALYRSGRHADALAVVADYRHVLADELGLDPSPALARLEHRVLTHDPALASARLGRGCGVTGSATGSGRDATAPCMRPAPGLDRELAIPSAGRSRTTGSSGRSSPRSGGRALRTPASCRSRLLARTRCRLPRDAPDDRGNLADRLVRGPLDAGRARSVASCGRRPRGVAEQGIVHGRVGPRQRHVRSRRSAVPRRRADRHPATGSHRAPTTAGPSSPCCDDACARTTRWPPNWRVQRPAAVPAWPRSPAWSSTASPRRRPIGPFRGTTRTRVCVRSTSPTPPTSSAAPASSTSW